MPWVEISQAALELGVSERTVRNWVRAGKLPVRTRDGQNEVEIPTPQQIETERMDDESSETALTPQKRLEVALLECGRIKGTLVSQERIMENLSANLAELNAKLQQTRGQVAKRTVFSVSVIFLGIITYLLSNAYNQDVRLRDVNAIQQQASREKDRYTEDIKSFSKEQSDRAGQMQERYLQEIRLMANTHASELLRIKEEGDRKLAEVRATLQQDAQEKIATLTGQLEKTRKELEQTQTEGKALKERLESGIAQFTAMQEAYRKTIAQLQQSQARAAELEKARTELSTTITELRNRLSAATPESLTVPPPPAR